MPSVRSSARPLRSIFSVLKARETGLHRPHRTTQDLFDASRGQPLPFDPATIGGGPAARGNPARAALTALIAFHGLRSAQLPASAAGPTCATDASTSTTEWYCWPSRSGHIAAHLDYRSRRWPTTANPHLFINLPQRGAGRAGREPLALVDDRHPRRQPSPREDRILDEAHASGGDTRRLCHLFGLSVGAATRYTDTVDHPDLIAQKDT